MDFNINNDTKILVVTPHQDDETIGCGGFLATYGKQCDVLLLTDGCKGIENLSDEETIVVRNNELEKAMKIAKVNNIYKLNIKNNELNSNRKKVESFNIEPYDLILLPNRKENHCDHKIVFNMFKKMKHIQNSKAVIYEYEVWTPLTNPTTFLNITKVIEQKKKMLSKYESQIKYRNYLSSTVGLNQYRGLFCNVEYAEAYMNSNYNATLANIYNILPDNLKSKIRKLFGGK